MSNQTRHILFDDKVINSQQCVDAIKDFSAYQIGRRVSEVGTIISYKSASIADSVYKRLKFAIGDENPIMRYIFPNFVTEQHYMQNRDSHFALFPERFLTPSRFVTPYLLNAVYHPLMALEVPSEDVASSISSAPQQHSTHQSVPSTMTSQFGGRSTPQLYSTHQSVPSTMTSQFRGRSAPQQYSTHQSVPSTMTSRLQDHSHRSAPNYLMQSPLTESGRHRATTRDEPQSATHSFEQSRRRRSSSGGTRSYVGPSSNPGYEQQSHWDTRNYPTFSSDTVSQSRRPRDSSRDNYGYTSSGSPKRPRRQ